MWKSSRSEALEFLCRKTKGCMSPFRLDGGRAVLLKKWVFAEYGKWNLANSQLKWCWEIQSPVWKHCRGWEEDLKSRQRNFIRGKESKSNDSCLYSCLSWKSHKLSVPVSGWKFEVTRGQMAYFQFIFWNWFCEKQSLQKVLSCILRSSTPLQ